MRRFLYALTAFVGTMFFGQTAMADWYPKVNPSTRMVEYWYDSTNTETNPPYAGNWVILAVYDDVTGWIQIAIPVE